MHLGAGSNGFLADAAAKGVDHQTATMELETVRESLMECAAKFGQDFPQDGSDGMKESPVRSKLRRKLEAKRAKARTAASNVQVYLGPLFGELPVVHLVF